jgi:hypothetical protein
MLLNGMLHAHLKSYCPEIHVTRLQAVMDVATGLQRGQKFSISAMGRYLQSDSKLKHRIKKVDRLLGNEHLYTELNSIYAGLSQYVFKYIAQDKFSPIVIDLCFLKDNHDVQMLSAEVATQGRTIPLYRDVFAINELKGREREFLSGLAKCIPVGRDVLIIMDAGFGDSWLATIEENDWYWLIRARKGKYLKLSDNDEWQEAGDLFDKAALRAKSYDHAYITKKQPRPCRVIMKKDLIGKRKKPLKLPRNYHSANNDYSRTAREPWILATNLPKTYDTTKVINAYKKRMQIEESFRDIKNSRYGLGSRHIQTRCAYRWGVCMLLAAIVQIMLWIIGVIGHSQGFQKEFQSNTVKDKKVFSYFYLGQLIVEFDKLKELNIDYQNISEIIETELARAW